MSSKDWKLSLFALAAVVLLSGCGDKKKKNVPGSPYTGIWEVQQNFNEYSKFSAANDTAGFCRHVSQNFDYYGEYNRNRVRLKTSIVIRSNGEVLNYIPGLPIDDRYRAFNYIGRLDAAGNLIRGYILPDGRVEERGWASQEDSGPFTNQSRWTLNGGDLMTAYLDGYPQRFVRKAPDVMKLYGDAAVGCFNQRRGRVDRRRYDQDARGTYLGPGPVDQRRGQRFTKDGEPELPQGAPAIDPHDGGPIGPRESYQ